MQDVELGMAILVIPGDCSAGDTTVPQHLKKDLS